MKMVGFPSRGGRVPARLLTLLLALIALVPRTCAAATSLKPELTESSNGTTNYESTSPSSPLDTSSPTEGATLSAALDITASVLLASLTSHGDATAAATAATATATAATDAATDAAHAPEPTTGITTPQAGSGNGGEVGGEEYYSSYDYPETASNNNHNNNHVNNIIDDNNNSINNSSSSSSKTGFVHKEPGVIPDPDTQDSAINLVAASRDAAPRDDAVRDDDTDADEADADEEMSLPDDSLADTDLHDHDLIDSVMYIYFGSTQRASGGAGRQVLIAGAAISLMAQFFALVSAARRMRAGSDKSTRIFLATELALTTTNLVFMLGVQATDKPAICKCVSLVLHTLYLVSSCWLFVISLNVYQRLVKGKDLSLTWCLLLIWMLPATLVRLCYVVNPRGFETHHYCWMSVERGMVLSFMVPMSTLILLNTAITVYCQRVLTRNEACCTKQSGFDGGDVVLRRALLSAAMLLPAFAIAWFLRVVALENDESVAVPVLAALTDAFLNWYIFLRSHVLLPFAEPVDPAAQLLFETDAQPLISPEMSPIHVISHPSGAAAAFSELRFDAISTITT